MSFADMQHLVDFRREFKLNLFSDAVSKLEIDPKLSDVMICTSIRKEDLNSCRITDDQRKEIKSKRVEEQQRKHRSIHKVRVASLPQIERKIIVLFGIDQYVDKTIPALQSAVSDIEAIGQLFADKLGYDEVRIVRNATRADIVRTLNELSIEMEANDSVVIYYAGHGYMNTKTGNGYWIPSDASAKDPQSWISNASISEMLANITSKQMVMISDSCYSGAFTKEQKVGLNIQNAKPDDILGKRSVVVMASGGDEPVADEGRGGHSIFAWFLMQALQNVENWKIGTNIFEQIQSDVKKSFPQVPQYGAAVSAGHQEGGDYLFEFRQLESIGN
ncbi:MAG: caspase family protein [Nitrosomonas sp.]|nr:caspase family protein [Nitrosomonas sp.]